MDVGQWGLPQPKPRIVAPYTSVTCHLHFCTTIKTHTGHTYTLKPLLPTRYLQRVNSNETCIAVFHRPFKGLIYQAATSRSLLISSCYWRHTYRHSEAGRTPQSTQTQLTVAAKPPWMNMSLPITAQAWPSREEGNSPREGIRSHTPSPVSDVHVQAHIISIYNTQHNTL